MTPPTVLIIDNYPKMSKLYAVSLETYVGANVIEYADIDQAVGYLKENTPQVIITRSKINERDVGKLCYSIISEKKLKTKLVVLGKTSLSAHHATTLEGEVSVNVVIKNVASILGVSAKEMAEQVLQEFYPFQVSLLFPRLQLICDVFTLDTSSGNHNIFLKKDSVIHAEIINILELQGHKIIYIHSADRLRFVNALIMHLSEFLADDKLSLQENILFSTQAYKMIRESALQSQITPEIILMTETSINTMMSIVNSIPKLSKLIEVTTKLSDTHYKHSLLISYITSHIISQLEWGSADQKIKLTFVSFFHNITVPTEYILINSEKLLLEEGLEEKRAEKVNKHALNSAKLISKFESRLPFGVETIIKQHHGSRDGIGFNKYPQSISPLALIFMVADEWVTTFMRAEQDNINLQNYQLLASMNRKFKGLSYRNILDALEKLT